MWLFSFCFLLLCGPHVDNMKLIIDKDRAKTDVEAPLLPLRLFEGRATLDKAGRLSFPASQHNISTFLQYAPDAQIKHVASLDFESLQTSLNDRPKFTPRREGRFWQKEAIEKIQALIDDPEKPRAFALFYRPGGGKSKSLVDMAMMLYCAGEIDACVVLPPNMLVAEQWVSDHGPLATDIQDDVKFASWIWGKTKAAKADYETLKTSDGCQFISMNIDAAKTPSGKQVLSDFISHHKGRILLAVDESHLIKTASSGRHKACVELGEKCAWRAILTGTPITKNLVDAWAQFLFLHEKIIGIRYVTTFKNRFCVQRFNGFANEVIGHKNIDEFYAKIAPFSVRVSEEEMGLEKVRDEFEFRLEGEQKRVFDEVKTKWLTSLDNGEFASASIALTAALKMHQISSGFLTTDEGNTHLFNQNARMDALDALLETLDDDKLVIWCRFRLNAEHLIKHLGKSAIEISGNIPVKEKTARKERFINDNDLRFLVATPDAAGTGMDGLQAVCNRAIFFNTSEHYVNRIQAEDRTLRLGGDTTAFYHDLIAKGSGDRRVIRNLTDKRDLSSMSLDEIRKVFSDE